MITKNSNTSHPIAFICIGVMFIAIGLANSEYRLSVLAGVLFIISVLYSLFKESKQKDSDQAN